MCRYMHSKDLETIRKLTRVGVGVRVCHLLLLSLGRLRVTLPGAFKREKVNPPAGVTLGDTDKVTLLPG